MTKTFDFEKRGLYYFYATKVRKWFFFCVREDALICKDVIWEIFKIHSDRIRMTVSTEPFEGATKLQIRNSCGFVYVRSDEIWHSYTLLLGATEVYMKYFKWAEILYVSVKAI